MRYIDVKTECANLVNLQQLYLADRIVRRTVALMLQCCVCLSVRNVLWLNAASIEQKLLLTAMRNRLVPK